jgi:4-amino-4-deoxy-L-arabinose transferase-like glycosyltransferase
MAPDNNYTQTRRDIFFDCLLIVFLTLVVYLPLLGGPAWDGDEPIRVIIAREMLKTGDWIVPVLHGKPYFVKPPMMNWLIALSGSLFGVLNEWTSRIPSVLMVLATSLSLYFMTSRWLAREERLLASLAFMSMTGSITEGRRAEIDALFVFFVVLTLLIWLNGYEKKWKPVILWGIPLMLLGAGFLTKGPHIIAFFYSTVAVYLLYKKRISFLFSGSHLMAVLLFIMIIAGYLMSISSRIDFGDYTDMWLTQIMRKTEGGHSSSFPEHIAVYPLQVAMSLMPWILVIFPVIIFRDLRIRVRELPRNELFLYSLIMMAINFPLYWLLPNAKVRHFLPAFPFFAIIVSMIFLRSLCEAKEGTLLLRRLILYFSYAVLLLVAGIPVAVYSLKLSYTLPLLLSSALLSFLALYAVYTSRKVELMRIPIYLVLFMGLAWLAYTDLQVQYESIKENHPKRIAQELNLLLPKDTRTVYEMGYRRFLDVTVYLDREVTQLDSFSRLRLLREGGKGDLYFIFNTRFLDTRKDEEKRVFHTLQWEKIYSKYLSKSSGEIIVGHVR